MAKKPSLTTITSGYTSTNVLNANFEALRQAFDNTVSRDGSVPNQLQADLDLNSNDILNVNTITDSTGDNLIASMRNLRAEVEGLRDDTVDSVDEFTDLYLGTKASAPTVDNDGDPLQLGAIYYDSTTSTLNVYDGSTFAPAYVVIPITGLPIAQGGTSATTAEQARTNLGAASVDEALALAIALG